MVVETLATPGDDMIDVTSIDPLPHPLLRDRGPSESDQVINIEDSPAPPTSKNSNSLDTTHTVNRTDESVPVTKEVEKGVEPILLSDNDDQVSSEGTVSVSLSPRLLSPPVAIGHTSFPFSRHDSTAQNKQVNKEQGRKESNIAVGAILPVTMTTVSMAAVTAVTPEAREVMKSPTPHNRVNDGVANTSSYTEKEEYNQPSLPHTITQTHATNKGSSHNYTTATITIAVPLPLTVLLLLEHHNTTLVEIFLTVSLDQLVVFMTPSLPPLTSALLSLQPAMKTPLVILTLLLMSTTVSLILHQLSLIGTMSLLLLIMSTV